MRIDALILRTATLDRVVAFYRALGLPLAPEQHGEGPRHFACDLGGAHIAVYAAEVEATEPSRPPGAPGTSMVGFQVESVERAYAAALAAGGRALAEPDDYPWGRRAVVLDPDGRAVELNCAPPAEEST